MSPFKAQVAVVTGASRGIGRAIALMLARQGARVCMVGRNRRNLEEVQAAGADAKKRLAIYDTDLEDDRALKDLAARLVGALPGIDILVHCAGTITLGTVAAAPIADFDRQFRVNARAPFFLTQALLPLLRARRGQVVFINSSAGLTARAGLAGYSASKHALKAIADALRDEVGKDGIRVVSIYPGRTATQMQREVLKAEGQTRRAVPLMPPDDVAEVVLDILKLERKAEVTDIHIRPSRRRGFDAVRQEGKR
jgi:NAD(P)-dependent dehydrogenase (short-subunit alcohol dehydrogenase family)